MSRAALQTTADSKLLIPIYLCVCADQPSFSISLVIIFVLSSYVCLWSPRKKRAQQDFRNFALMDKDNDGLLDQNEASTLRRRKAIVVIIMRRHTQTHNQTRTHAAEEVAVHTSVRRP